VNEIAEALGGFQSIVDLTSISLLRASDSFSTPDHLNELLHSLENEAQLHATGAIMARAELVRALMFRNNLDLHHQPKRKYCSVDGSNEVFIIGLARSGTSLLQRSLSQHNNIYAPMTYEVLVPGAMDGNNTSQHITSATLQDELWNLLDPNFSSIHRNAGDLPAECLPIQSASMLSHHWTGCYSVPSYERYLDARTSQEPFRVHRTFCEFLERKRPESLLLLKSPAYARQIRSLMLAYPKARFILSVRSIHEALASHVRLLRSIRSMRSLSESIQEKSEIDGIRYFEVTIKRLISEIEKGALGRGNLYAIAYDDLLRDPSRTVGKILQWLFRGDHNDLRRTNLRGERFSYDRVEFGSPNTAPAVETPQALEGAYNELVKCLNNGGCFHA
jgi:hypothetical protein